MSEMPVFDDLPSETSAPAEQPPKRKPRKPMKRRARAVPLAPVPKKRTAKKGRVGRRGRPPGALNKPKSISPPVDNSPSATSTLLSVCDRVNALLSVLSTGEREAVLKHLLKP